ncbi:hypothetical protein [Marisediminicola senii]|uniref:hypothetical protein n=1 Tax=Marisediminicola senii TaxID=2711233 RepID=UPI0013EA63DF|nr:hypothetical protein [Marisediminicola senii]
MNRLTRCRPLLLLTVAASLAVAFAVGLAPAHAAQAETPGVDATCSTLSVKPKGFAAKGEVRVTIDGEVQTEGTDDGWRSFTGSFTGVYRFDPVLEHEYTVEVNSFGADSAGRDFSDGEGYDASYTGPTTPCAPVEITASGSNCVSDTRVDKMTLNLEISELRRSTTYLVEVLAHDEVVTHFQFRTAPVVQKTFSGLTAGERYEVRVTDQSDDALSSRTSVLIPGCAAPIALDATATSCATPGSAPAIVAELSGLVDGRSYEARLTPGDRVQAVSGSAADSTLTFGDLEPGTGYVVTVTDDAAPRSVTSDPIDVAECATAPVEGPGTSTPGAGTGSGNGNGAGTGSEGSTPPVDAPGTASPDAETGSEGTPAVTAPTGTAGVPVGELTPVLADGAGPAWADAAITGGTDAANNSGLAWTGVSVAAPVLLGGGAAALLLGLVLVALHRRARHTAGE